MKKLTLGLISTAILMVGHVQAEGVLGNQASLGLGLPSDDSEIDKTEWRVDLDADYFVHPNIYLHGQYQRHSTSSNMINDITLSISRFGGGLGFEMPVQLTQADDIAGFIEGDYYHYTYRRSIGELDTSGTYGSAFELSGGIRADVDPLLAEIALNFNSFKLDGLDERSDLVTTLSALFGAQVSPELMAALELSFEPDFSESYLGVRLAYLF